MARSSAFLVRIQSPRPSFGRRALRVSAEAALASPLAGVPDRPVDTPAYVPERSFRRRGAAEPTHQGVEVPLHDASHAAPDERDQHSLARAASEADQPPDPRSRLIDRLEFDRPQSQSGGIALTVGEVSGRLPINDLLLVHRLPVDTVGLRPDATRVAVAVGVVAVDTNPPELLLERVSLDVPCLGGWPGDDRLVGQIRIPRVDAHCLTRVIFLPARLEVEHTGRDLAGVVVALDDLREVSHLQLA